MKYRILGKTGFKVSEIGFGVWGLGGDSYGPVDDNVSKKALKLAFDLGVTFYDTSDLYGNGHSEEILGEVFKNVRDKVIIATKGGTLPHTGFYMPQDFSARHLKKALERSLKRLKTDYIDLYQLHSPTIADIEENNVIEALENFKAQGKIRAYGISVRSPNDGKIAIEKYNFPVVQVNFNMIDQRAIENGLFDPSKEHETGIIVRTPLVFGYLTGKLDGNEQFKGIDHRANWPKEQLKTWASAPNLFSFLYKDKTPVQAALRFCLDFEAVSTVIPGMMNITEVEENVKTSELKPLSPEEHQYIQQLYQSHEFYDKSSKKVKK